MSRLKVISLLLGLVIASAQASKLDIATFAIAPNGKGFALITETPHVFRLNQGGLVKEIKFPELDRVRDVDPAPSVSWSKDSNYVAIQFNASEDTSYVEIIDVKNMDRIWKSRATSSVWMKERNSLLVVPAYPIDGTQLTPGLLSFDADHKKVSILAKKFFFTGDIQTGLSSIIARTVRMINGFPVYSVIFLDCKSGRSQEIR